MTCAEYARRSPSVLWLRARDCDIDYLNAGYRESRGTIQELFFAVRPAGASRTQPAVLVMATRDPSVLAIAQGGIGEGQQPNQEQFLIMMLRIVTALNAARRIEGRLRVGWMDRLRARRVLSGLTTPVAPSAMVVDLHASPAYTGPAIQMALGTALVIAAIVLFRKGRRTELDLVPAAEPVLATEPVVTTPVRLRGLLLLNLAPGANAADIEYAPPLGNRDEVIERIAQAIGGIQFDARGRGVLRVPEVAAIIDVGRAEDRLERDRRCRRRRRGGRDRASAGRNRLARVRADRGEVSRVEKPRLTDRVSVMSRRIVSRYAMGTSSRRPSDPLSDSAFARRLTASSMVVGSTLEKQIRSSESPAVSE